MARKRQIKRRAPSKRQNRGPRSRSLGSLNDMGNGNKARLYMYGLSIGVVLNWTQSPKEMVNVLEHAITGLTGQLIVDLPNDPMSWLKLHAVSRGHSVAAAQTIAAAASTPTAKGGAPTASTLPNGNPSAGPSQPGVDYPSDLLKQSDFQMLESSEVESAKTNWKELWDKNATGTFREKSQDFWGDINKGINNFTASLFGRK